jgi:elongation factor P
MLNANELRKGTTFILDGKLYQVIEYQHYKPGRGNAIIRTKIRDLRSGSIIPRNFLSGERFEEAPVERRVVNSSISWTPKPMTSSASARR